MAPLLAACGSAESAQKAEQLRRAIFETCIAMLNTKHLQTKDARDLIGKLLFEVYQWGWGATSRETALRKKKLSSPNNMLDIAIVHKSPFFTMVALNLPDGR